MVSVLWLLALTRPARAGGCEEDFMTGAAGAEPLTAGCVRKIMEWFTVEYPDNVQVYPYGFSGEGRQLIAMRVTSAPTTSTSWNRPSAMVLSRTHGNEYNTERNTLDWIRWVISVAGAAILSFAYTAITRKGKSETGSTTT